ncbi:unnamed protein product [Blepharisma stoltei]|uniref:Uncharacterized protein n=1 Tax=Blepharisma stoltei TaxID=1481888 RepID=A0AAU9KBR2_9CILI|nr:unnamed protein product [Blepharisma stoltei]
MDAPLVVDLGGFLDHMANHPNEPLPQSIRDECQKVAENFHSNGILIARDPRVNEQANWDFIDMMEQYYLRASNQLYNGEKVAEVHPELHFQIGATPENVEKARNHCERINNLPEDSKAVSECPPQYDAKWRYFWRIGSFGTPSSEVDPENVVPPEFPEWASTMNNWGDLMLRTVETVVRMFEVASGVEPEKIVDMMRGAPHLLAPTGADLRKWGKGTVFAGYHYDLNFITIHGKSRFPGLSAWMRNNKKIDVAVPSGCLLLQAGKLFEYITGGYVLAGYHEVVFNDRTEAAVNTARENGKILWRVSSTLFGHFRHDVVLQPMEEFADRFILPREETMAKYPPLTAADSLKEELRLINLWKNENPEAPANRGY